MEFITVEERAKKVAEFFGVKKPEEITFQQWNDMLFDLEMKWEEDNERTLPI